MKNILIGFLNSFWRMVVCPGRIKQDKDIHRSILRLNIFISKLRTTLALVKVVQNLQYSGKKFFHISPARFEPTSIKFRNITKPVNPVSIQSLSICFLSYFLFEFLFQATHPCSQTLIIKIWINKIKTNYLDFQDWQLVFSLSSLFGMTLV